MKHSNPLCTTGLFFSFIGVLLISYAISIPAFFNESVSINYKDFLRLALPSICVLLWILLCYSASNKKGRDGKQITLEYIGYSLMMLPVWIILGLLMYNTPRNYVLLKSISNMTSMFGSVLLGLGLNMMYRDTSSNDKSMIE